MASATWRLTVLSRMPSPCFLIGAPFQHGRMRLTEPRGFRGLQYWVWLFHFFIAFRSFLHKICNPQNCILRGFDLYSRLRILNKLIYLGFPDLIHKSTNSSALCCESRLYPAEKDKLKLVILIVCRAQVVDILY